MFVDEATIEIEAGKGGNGSASFRREKYIPKGGPDGGDGGNGGSIFVTVKENMHGLANVKAKRVFKAGNGESGRSKKQHGKNGSDIIIELPPGTIIYDYVTNDVILDLRDTREKVKIAKGGKGGLGNVHFASSTNRTPREFTEGTQGQKLKLKLEVKHLADVGLIGLPNAGKSTLLTVLSAAQPEIGNYPFTTLEPHLGRMNYKNRSVTIADIPGLIEGASTGKGLGHKFLRHVQRVSLLVHLISSESADIVADYQIIRQELAKFDSGLLEVPEILVISKSDLSTPNQILKLKKEIQALKKNNIYTISSAKKDGIYDLMKAIMSLTGSA